MTEYLKFFKLTGKTALITGAANGIGAEISKAFYQMGANVVITDLDVSLGQELAQSLGERATFIKLDVTNEKDWQSVIEQTQSIFGGLHILVNNAGIFHASITTQESLEKFRKVQEINVDSVFLGCKHALPAMAASATVDDRASIINLSSVAGLVGQPGLAAYNASKGAVRLLTKSVAMECAVGQLPIRVNSIHPCIVKTNMANQVFDGYAQNLGVSPEEAEAMISAQHPLGQLAEARDIATSAIFLASDASRMMTGSELIVDAGFCAQ